MGKYLTLTNSDSEAKGIKKRTLRREIVIGPNAIKFVTIAIFAVLALVYLTQSTAGANRSIQVRDLNDKKTRLELKEEQLEVEKNRLKSLREIDATIEKTSLEPVSKVEHIESRSSELARID